MSESWRAQQSGRPRRVRNQKESEKTYIAQFYSTIDFRQYNGTYEWFVNQIPFREESRPYCDDQIHDQQMRYQS